MSQTPDGRHLSAGRPMSLSSAGYLAQMPQNGATDMGMSHAHLYGPYAGQGAPSFSLMAPSMYAQAHATSIYSGVPLPVGMGMQGLHMNMMPMQVTMPSTHYGSTQPSFSAPQLHMTPQQLTMHVPAPLPPPPPAPPAPVPAVASAAAPPAIPVPPLPLVAKHRAPKRVAETLPTARASLASARTPTVPLHAPPLTPALGSTASALAVLPVHPPAALLAATSFKLLALRMIVPGRQHILITADPAWTIQHLQSHAQAVLNASNGGNKQQDVAVTQLQDADGFDIAKEYLCGQVLRSGDTVVACVMIHPALTATDVTSESPELLHKKTEQAELCAAASQVFAQYLELRHAHSRAEVLSLMHTVVQFSGTSSLSAVLRSLSELSSQQTGVCTSQLRALYCHQGDQLAAVEQQGLDSPQALSDIIAGLLNSGCSKHDIIHKLWDCLDVPASSLAAVTDPTQQTFVKWVMLYEASGADSSLARLFD